MKKIIILALFILIESFSHSVALAQDGTPSSTIDVDKIKKIVSENLAATEKSLTAQTKFTGRTGIIKSIGAKNLTLEIDKDITQVNLSNSDTKPSSLAIGNKIVVMGILTKDNVLDARRIILVEEEKPEDVVLTEAVVAQLSKIDLKKKTFNMTINKQVLAYTLSKKTTVKLEDFKDGDTIFGISKKYQGKFSLSRAIKI